MNLTHLILTFHLLICWYLKTFHQKMSCFDIFWHYIPCFVWHLIYLPYFDTKICNRLNLSLYPSYLDTELTSEQVSVKKAWHSKLSSLRSHLDYKETRPEACFASLEGIFNTFVISPAHLSLKSIKITKKTRKAVLCFLAMASRFLYVFFGKFSNCEK